MSDSDYETNDDTPALPRTSADPEVILCVQGEPGRSFTGFDSITRACCVAEGFLKSGRKKITIEIRE